MRRKNTNRATVVAVAGTLAAAAIALGGCGDGSSEPDPGSENPEAAATAEEFASALADAPPKLAAVYDQGDAILDGGLEAYEAQIGELEGTPIVVNKWASWCGPCRFEFPFFQSQVLEHGTEIAFLGVDTDDSVDAAETFLAELPLPYPSFADPDSEIADELGLREFPSTVFYDSAGEIAYVRRGGYGSEEELAADVDEYAR
jgi:cytochrome c biogenesis protein CcmG/thiol:disulfide interchange protein DsbE